MGLSIWQIALVVILFVLLFGRGRLSGLMTDLADGIKSFRNSMNDDDAGQPDQRPELTDERSEDRSTASSDEARASHSAK